VAVIIVARDVRINKKKYACTHTVGDPDSERPKADDDVMVVSTVVSTTEQQAPVKLQAAR